MVTADVQQRYPKRLKEKKKKYTEEELSDEDEYLCKYTTHIRRHYFYCLVCEDCEQIHHGDCPVHGPLLTLDYSSGHDEASLQYTAVQVPNELNIRPSTIDNAGLGVYATQSISKGVRFGPYKGQKVYEEDIDEGDDTSYMWEV